MFEYKTITVATADLQAKLNEMSQAGWEFLALHPAAVSPMMGFVSTEPEVIVVFSRQYGAMTDADRDRLAARHE